jgi:hypothetical protein
MVTSMHEPASVGGAAPPVVSTFLRVWSEIGPGRPLPLEELYAEDVVFEDPLHRVEGLPALRAHADRLNANLRRCRFEHGARLVGDGEAFLTWSMHIDLRRGPKRTIVVPGTSHIRFADRVRSQRDYFDVGALVYEQIPLLGGIVRAIKRRM